MFKFSRRLITLALVVLTAIPAIAAADGKFETQPWLEDFAQLRQILAEDYPNLVTQAQAYDLNLPELNKKTEERIRQADSDSIATEALKNFLASFKDGHLQLQVPKQRPGGIKKAERPDVNRDTPGTIACKVIADWRPADFNFPFPVDKTLGFTGKRLQADAFASTMLKINKTKVGLIRIPSFVPAQYPSLCADEWEKFRKTLKSKCDLECQDSFFNFQMQNRLLAEFENSLNGLIKSNIQALLLDLTDNGGGKDWVAGVMRIVTRHKLLCGQFGFIRHPHWTMQFEEQKRELDKKIAACRDPAAAAKLSKDLEQVKSDLQNSKIKCSRLELWNNASFVPNCDLVVKRQLDSCEPSADLHFSPGLFDGPLFILTNKRTASAAEDIVGRFKDSATGILIGERTAGAGCGFTNNGISLKLNHSQLVVKVPDCARYSRSGVNEVEGISPDINLDMSEVETKTFVVKLIAALGKKVR